MTPLILLTIATSVALLAVALLPALWLQRFIVRGFPSQRVPPAPPSAMAQPPRSVLHTVG